MHGEDREKVSNLVSLERSMMVDFAASGMLLVDTARMSEVS
jgi:hypothetical protein